MNCIEEWNTICTNFGVVLQSISDDGYSPSNIDLLNKVEKEIYSYLDNFPSLISTAQNLESQDSINAINFFDKCHFQAELGLTIIHSIPEHSDKNSLSNFIFTWFHRDVLH